ncbi:MAG: hypothetical protein HYV09_19060 [Deltaproteobacteria bacterium]|nr:hypothetical protein [Deltaproteobacteria bacterium]
MSSLRTAPPRPASSRVGPAYPRVIAAVAIALAGCGGVVQNEGRETDKPSQQLPSPGPAGVADAPFDDPTPAPPDTGVEDTQPAPTDGGQDASETASETLPDPSPDGIADFPFDSGAAPDEPADPEEDAGR